MSVPATDTRPGLSARPPGASQGLAPDGQPAAALSVPAQTPAAAGQAMQLDLRDIHLPGAPPVWPPAPGWWLLGALLLAGLAAAAVRLRDRRRAWRRRERIMAELDGLLQPPQPGPAAGCGPELLGGVSALLKRAALSRFPRTEVASLTGPDWLAFLDRTGGAGGFVAGPGRVLESGAYAPEQDCDATAVVELARRWLRHNL